jgi:hypothetical protein
MNFLKRAFNTVAQVAKRIGGTVITAAANVAQVPLQAIYSTDAVILNALDSVARRLEFNKLATPLLWGTMIAAVPFSATAAGVDYLSGFIHRPVNTSKMG